MKRGARIVLGICAVLAGLPVAALLLLLVLANIDPGRRLAERLIADVTDGTVRVEALGGRFPDRLRAGHVEVRDAGGLWASLDDLAIDWSPLRLLHGEADIARLAARRVALARLPAAGANGETSSSTGFVLPVRLTVRSLALARLDLAAPVAGLPASLAVDGDLHLATEQDGTVALTVRRLDAAGTYGLSGTVSPGRIEAKITANEPAEGLLASLAGLPDIGPLAVTATLAGPRTAEQAGFTVAAGPLRAAGRGTIDLAGRTLDLGLSASAPAMKPSAALSWSAVTLDSHVSGSFASPDATGHLDIRDLSTAEGGIAEIRADLAGSTGGVGITASLAGLDVPGLDVPGLPPGLFAAAPVTLRADVRLDQAARPVTFTVSHPLIRAAGRVDTGAGLAGAADVMVADLAPLAAAFGLDLRGSTAMTARFSQHGDRTQLALDGTLGVTGGMPLAVGLIGADGKFTFGGALEGETIAIDRATIDGAALHASTEGAIKGDALDLRWKAGLSDLSRLVPTLRGALSANGTVEGPQADFALAAAGHADVAAPDVPTGPVDFSLTAAGLPGRPSGKIEARGSLAGSPLQLVAQVSRDPDGTMRVAIEQARWKSAEAGGALSLPAGSDEPSGQVKVRAARLDDLAPFIGVSVSGSADATVEMAQVAGKPRARLSLDARGLGVEGNRVDHVTLSGWVDDPLARPAVNLQLRADGIAAEGVAGSAGLDAKGPMGALALHLDSRLHVADGDAKLSADATAAPAQKTLRVSALQADYRGETVRLLAPARIALARGVAVDRLRLGIADAELSVAGRVLPTLDLTAAAHNLRPALAKPFMPSLRADGRIDADATLGGTLAAPTGSIRVSARQLRWRSLSGRALPPAELDATAHLKGDVAQLDMRLTAGDLAALTLAGAAPMGDSGKLDLKTTGSLDLRAFDPILTAAGRSVAGRLDLDLAVAGTVDSPQIAGSVRLSGGVFQDFTQGVHLIAVEGVVEADGAALRITHMSGRAGPGSFTVTGTVEPLAPGMPVDLAITGRNMQPLATDMLTANLDADLTIKGAASGALVAAGRIGVKRADINIPDSLPPSVVALNVSRPGAAPPPPSAFSLRMDVTVDAPEQIFVRGHGLDAEMSGTLHVQGDTETPRVGGGFDLRRGTFSLAGQTIDITSGRVTFNGTGPSGKLDPSLDFVAQNISNGITAVLTVTGYADAPVIKLSSTPPLPSDEILARLLFNESTSQLTPLQIAGIAQAVASLSGVGGGFDPVATIRKTLGIDRLSVGSSSGTNSGTTVEAGKYVAQGIYVGTKQGLSGGTQAQVQIDLTHSLKLESTLGAGSGTPVTGATIDNDPGSSVGLTYQFEY